ncbi:hypothetical protein [Polyangium jinanense]|uniref:Outer membrane protein beta-barrel domain-containing protein n=1 Tax=Polyangium jinanense TaxID=2829994 RepID=A0A9X4ARJ4_9BACT|nr:hypothetical protein [Polyangium jinanense]MDC3981501.1 hypothetical protein [Polyangium jinanense]
MSREKPRGIDIAFPVRMTIMLRFSTSLASALLVTSMALHASATDPPAPASDAEPRKHSLSVTAGLTPLYFGSGISYDDRGAEYENEVYAYKPLLAGLSVDYMRSFGLVRAGVGLRYMYTQDNGHTFANELGITGLFSLGGTTKSGVDIAATLGFGIGHTWVRRYNSPGWGGTGELLLSVAIPVSETSDFFLRSGLSMAYFTGNAPEVPEGYWPPHEPYLIRAYIPFELGFRRRF